MDIGAASVGRRTGAAVFDDVGAAAGWPFYLALAYFKLAIIAAGVDFRDRLAAGGAAPDWDRDVVAPLVAAGLKSLSA